MTIPAHHGMRNASEAPTRTGFTCASCGRYTVTAVEGHFANPRVGSTQRFCSPACRQAAWRRRQSGVSENTPRQRTGGRARRLRADRNLPHDPDRRDPS